MPIVCNVGDVKYLFYTKVNDSDHHPVEAEDEKSADGYEGNQFTLNVV